MATEIAVHERVLLIGIPGPQLLLELAGRVASGALVGMGDPQAVTEARRATADLDNVMFHPGEPEEIPWADHHFHRVICFAGPLSDAAEREVRRVLLPGGEFETGQALRI
jgi:hypothetical protein